MLDRFKRAVEDMGQAAKSIGHLVNTQVSSGQLDETELQLQNEWNTALPQNRLPDSVERRLTDTGARKLPWISTQKPIELSLGQSHGFRPVGMVNGTCWYHFGYSWTDGHKIAWETALYRLIYEAQLMKAHAVVDIQFSNKRLGQDSSEMDYMVTGTALALNNHPIPKIPVLTTLTAMKFVRLLEVNLVPVGIAIGAAYEYLYYGVGGFMTQGFAGQNLYQSGGSGYGNTFGQSGLQGGFMSGLMNQGGMFGSFFNQEVLPLSNLANKVRNNALYQLKIAAGQQKGNYLLGNDGMFQILNFDGQTPGQSGVLARQITMGTVLEDTHKSNGNQKRNILNIKAVLDLSDTSSLIHIDV